MAKITGPAPGPAKRPARRASRAAHSAAVVFGAEATDIARAKSPAGRLSWGLQDQTLLANALTFEVINLELTADALGISKVQWAETIGLSRETAYRPKRMEAPKAQARTREVVEIITRITDWAGGEQQALSWYRAHPIEAFGGRTAEALVKDGKAAAVREYLDHIALGGFA